MELFNTLALYGKIEKLKKIKSWGIFQEWCEDLFEEKLHNLDVSNFGNRLIWNT
jgi:hypothetical protein